MLGSLILYLKGMRTAMFQLSGFYCIVITTNTVHHPHGFGFGISGWAGTQSIASQSSRWLSDIGA